jgi:hypothetical protein
LPLLAIVSTALLIAGLIISTALAGETFPSPFAASEAVQAYVGDNAGALRVTAFFSFASSVPLAIYAATASARLHTLGIRNPGASIALAGGVLAAGSLALSGMASWVLGRARVAGDPAVVQALHALAFVSGGPGHVVGLGLLVAGMAVPGLLAGLLPRPLALVGLVLAGVAELSSLALLIDGAMYLVPVARFVGLAWLIIAAVLLPARRPAADT